MSDDARAPDPPDGQQGSVFGNLPGSRPGRRSPRRDAATTRTKPEAKPKAARAKSTATTPKSQPRPKSRPPREPERAPEADEGGHGLEDIAWAGVAAAAEAATLGVRLANRALEALRGNSERD